MMTGVQRKTTGSELLANGSLFVRGSN